MLLPPFLMEHFPLSQINDLTKEKYRKKDVKGKWMDITSESCYTISKNRSLSRLQQKKTNNKYTTGRVKNEYKFTID